MRLKFSRKSKILEIEPDQIFLDSKNLPNFNRQQFEGRIEKPIPKRTVNIFVLILVSIFVIFSWQVSVLQIVKGENYFQKSENNTLNKIPVFADRGIIYDRQGNKLAWNSWEEVSDLNRYEFPKRKYISASGFGHLLGFVSTPEKDSSGKYWQENFIGKDGVEKIFDDLLKGENGEKLIETDVRGNIQSENIFLSPKAGQNINLSIDSRIQKKLYESIANMAINSNFNGGAGIIMDIENGEILAITNYPEYNSEILSEGAEQELINKYLTDKRKVFLNRAVSGLYSPGSIVKPFIGYGALAENIISPTKLIFSNGSISIPNPYFPDKKSVFKDHGTFGYVDMKKAIAVSSDVYFYEIGGGYQDQKGLGILKINDYIKKFGITEKTGTDLLEEKTGTIPNPEWKAKTFKGEIWRVGDTYNTSIGQYGFQVTPIQMVRAVAGIANNGKMPIPHILLGDNSFDLLKTLIEINPEKMEVIKEGMRMAVTEGTATALYSPQVKVAAKSGTAQVGLGNTNTNSWIIGFFPYEKPKYSFAVLMERGPKVASGNSTRVMREVIDFIYFNTPEYLE